MASSKKLTLRCTGISMLSDGRQSIAMSKQPDAATTKTATATVINSPDAQLQLAVDPTEASNYAVGKDYTVTITG